jgi:subtilisin family serine protease
VSDLPDVFEEVLALLSPERLLLDPHATGEGVSVCIIDSGVERAVLESKFASHPIHRVEGGIFTAESADPLPYEGRQSSPHGTTVADIVLSLAPGVRLFSADVFGPRGTCEVEVLVRAIRWAADVWHCKVINLSLGVPEQRMQQPQRRQQLQRAIEECYHNDILVIAAAHNEHPHTRSYPAAFAPPLLSVDKRLFTDPLQFAYEPSGQIEFSAHGRGYLGPFAAEPATSWAAPHLTGIAARILSLRPELKPFEMKTILYWLSRPRRK